MEQGQSDFLIKMNSNQDRKYNKKYNREVSA